MEQNYNEKGEVVETEEAKKTEEVKPPKNGTIIEPDGSKKVWVDGVLAIRISHGTTQFYDKDGGLRSEISPDKKRIDYDENGKPKTS